MKFLNNIDLKGNEIQNFKVQNLAVAPANPLVGQHYFNTVDKTEYVYNGTKWVDALSQGDFVFQNGVKLGEGRVVELNLSEAATDVTLTADENGLSAKVNLTGYAKAETAADLTAADTLKEALGKLEAKADEKVVANEAITGDTKCKVTYDEKGLVTGGADLEEADIPTLGAAKIGNLTGYAKADAPADLAETDTALEAFGKIQASLDSKIGLDAVSIETGSADVLTYNNTTGELGAQVDTAVTADSAKLISSGAVHEAIKDHIELTDLSVDAASADYASYDNTTGALTIKGGVANGLATLDANGFVPSTQLPSYVDDVIEFVAMGEAPAEGAAKDMYFDTASGKIMTHDGNGWTAPTDPETGKIYVANNMAYRWSGSSMVQIGADKLKGFNQTIVGDGTTTSFTITHGLATRNVVFEIYEAASPFEKVYVQVQHTTVDTLTVMFGSAPAVGEDYVITVIAIA